MSMRVSARSWISYARSGLYDSTLVVVVGDHGEGLGDHGETEHGFFIYQNTLHVPLIVRLPSGGVRGGQIDENVSLIDLMPTVLGLLGVQIPEQVEGADLSGDVAGTSRSNGSRLLYSESLSAGTIRLQRLVRRFGRQLEVHSVPKAGALRPRPRRRREGQSRRTRSRRLLAACGTAWRNGGGRRQPRHARKQAAAAPLGQDTLRRLESLGYVGGGTAPGGAGSDLGQEDPKDFVAVFERCKAGCNLLEKHRLAEARKEFLEVDLAPPSTCLGPLLAGRDRPARISSRPGNRAIVGGFVDFERIQGCRHVFVAGSECRAGRAMPDVSRPRADHGQKAGPSHRRVPDRLSPRPCRVRGPHEPRHPLGYSGTVPRGRRPLPEGTGNRR